MANTCKECGKEDLAINALDVMKDTLETKGDTITFNIALKCLANTGNTLGYKGILIGMLKEGTEPNAASYTTAVGVCAKEGNKDTSAASVDYRAQGPAGSGQITTHTIPPCVLPGREAGEHVCARQDCIVDDDGCQDKDCMQAEGERQLQVNIAGLA